LRITKVETLRLYSRTRHYVVAYNASTHEEYVKTGKIPRPKKPWHGSALVVKVYTDEGVVGLGEGGSEEVIGNLYTPKLIGEDPFDVERIHEKLGKNLYDEPASRAAVDAALLDIMGKALKVPVYRLLGGRYRDRIPVAWVIGWKSPEETAAEALKYFNRGFRTLKLKVGIALDVDVARVKAVREAVGEEAAIRVDFNQAYTPRTAVKAIKAMEPYGLEFAEQPVNRMDLKGMAAVAKAVETPVSADDSAYSPVDAYRIAEMHAADVINIYILKAGGLSNAKKIAAVGEAAGIPCFLGAAPALSVEDIMGVHVAASTRNIGYACEFVGNAWYELSELKNPLRIVDGMALVPEKPGLGVELNDENIKVMGKPSG